MQAVIMAGGYGTRLRPLTNELPKPMVPIINKPIIVYIIELLKSHGITDIILTLGYKPEVIMDYLGDGKEFGVKLTYVIETEPLGTAGGVKNVSKLIDGTFLVMSGDAFTNVNIRKLLNHHFDNGKLGTLAVKEVANPIGFGIVKVDSYHVIRNFIEKPLTTVEKLVNTGIYVFEREVLDLIPDGKYDFGRELFPRLLGELSAYKMNEYWSDIGTLSSYYLTNNDVVINPSAFNVQLN